MGIHFDSTGTEEGEKFDDLRGYEKGIVEVQGPFLSLEHVNIFLSSPVHMTTIPIAPSYVGLELLAVGRFEFFAPYPGIGWVSRATSTLLGMCATRSTPRVSRSLLEESSNAARGGRTSTAGFICLRGSFVGQLSPWICGIGWQH